MLNMMGASVQPPAAAAAPGMTPQNDLHAKWMAHLTDPQVRAALMQFGVGMLQPRNNGQTFAGQVGQSIAEGGQAAARVQTTQLEIGKQARQEARDQARLENERAGVKLEGERNKIAATQAETQAGSLAETIRSNKAGEAQAVEDNKIKAFQAKSLDLYYKSLAGAASTKAAPAGYKEALDALKEASLLQDDPMAYFMTKLPEVNAQFSGGAAAAPAPAAAGAAPAVPVAPGAGATAAPPADAVNLLRQDPSASNRQYFDQIFGPGAAARALGEGQ